MDDHKRGLHADYERGKLPSSTRDRPLEYSGQAPRVLGTGRLGTRDTAAASPVAWHREAARPAEYRFRGGVYGHRVLRRQDRAWLEELARHAPIGRYLHNRTGEDNADAHLKRAAETRCTSQVMGREVVVAVTNGRLDGSTEPSA